MACRGTSVSEQIGLCTQGGGTVNAESGVVHMGGCDCIQRDMVGTLCTLRDRIYTQEAGILHTGIGLYTQILGTVHIGR